MLCSDLLGTYYGVCTICWLCDTSSCHCEDSFIFVLKKKMGRHMASYYSSAYVVLDEHTSTSVYFDLKIFFVEKSF
jgi:hypothetical protein